MRSIIFGNILIKDTTKLEPTIDVEHYTIHQLGNLWDCGGQEKNIENYLTNQREYMFDNVKVLIYVFDITKIIENLNDLKVFKEILKIILQYNKDVKVFCLFHKMDLILESDRMFLLKEKQVQLNEYISDLKFTDITYFGTSIWDETLYKAWSSIIYSLIPNIKQIEKSLNYFTKICGVDEIVLFEKNSFLIISHSTIKNNNQLQQELDVHRFEKISNIIKQFKLSCLKGQSLLQSLEVKNSQFSAFIEEFTLNTYIMVISSDKNIQSETVHMNIEMAKKYFENLINL